MNTGNASIKPKKIKTPDAFEFSFIGPELDQGKLPAFFYLSLSGDESLSLHPYNQPAAYFQNLPCRIFSFTLPGHGDGFDKFVAMEYWAKQIASEPYFLDHFFELSAQAIRWLIEEEYISPGKIAIGGLSRGAFAATHIATKVPQITALVGYAPLTCLGHLSSFNPYLDYSNVAKRLPTLNLSTLVPKLSHLKALSFYSGTHDTLVGTNHCIDFVRALANAKMNVELLLYPSIGHGGHGTPPHIFQKGAKWVKTHLLED